MRANARVRERARDGRQRRGSMLISRDAGVVVLKGGFSGAEIERGASDGFWGR